MSKELKSRDELQRMMLAEATACGKCSDIEGISIIGPIPVSAPHARNWNFAIIRKGPEMAVECMGQLNLIAGLMGAKYDLQDGR